jgi:hypothetical protein
MTQFSHLGKVFKGVRAVTPQPLLSGPPTERYSPDIHPNRQDGRRPIV